MQEIGPIGSYQDTDFTNLKEAIQSAWWCYGEAGCYPQIELCFIEVPRRKKSFCIRQEQLIAHWIKTVLRPEIWAENSSMIGKDALCYPTFGNDNYITLKPANATCAMICIEDPETKRKSASNNIMNIYSIGRDTKTLDEVEFDVVVNKAINEPLVLVVGKSILNNDLMRAFLIEKCNYLEL